ncbi:lipoprotein-releasing system transmembrane subunit LolC [Neisseria sp. KEM232]|uniref:lipoprotein-releasing ABC transporter permease subunit n=1 Tax=Neisseria sp. KEM232 TaxID=655307 RepID=UPI000B8C3BC9|nr:lipoprotein-releasing ABC transporter permease subunit [Neisseria sp. KEM232]ASP18256.1 lipoprotein-releasing system transmembrane subunit LolC [Neisseria sp. KEM232]
MISLETWIGLRYLRAKKRSGFMSFIGIISIVGIAIGVMALITVISVVNGFQKDVRSQLFSVAPHAEIGFYDAGAGSWQDLRKLVAGNKNVVGSAPYIADQALLANNGEVRGVQIRGIDPAEEKQVVDYWRDMPSGGFESLRPGEFDIILGSGLAEALGVETGGKVTVITPEGNVTPAGMVPRLKQFNLVGTVKTGIYELDNALALTHIDDAQTLYRLESGFAGLRLKLADPQNAPAVAASLLPAGEQDKVWVRDWTFSNQSYFNAVELEKKMLFVIMFFISLVASINLISTLIMTVTEKQSAIAILRTQGLPPSGIMKIFFVQGALLGLIGTAFGTVFGLLLAANIGAILKWVEGLMGRKLIESQVYFLDYLPSHIVWSDVATIVSISIGLSLLVTLYPSWRAAKTEPAEALRYE